MSHNSIRKDVADIVENLVETCEIGCDIETSGPLKNHTSAQMTTDIGNNFIILFPVVGTVLGPVNCGFCILPRNGAFSRFYRKFQADQLVNIFEK